MNDKHISLTTAKAVFWLGAFFGFVLGVLAGANIIIYGTRYFAG